MDPGNYASW